MLKFIDKIADNEDKRGSFGGWKAVRIKITIKKQFSK